MFVVKEWESSVLAPPALHMMAFDSDSDGNDTHGNHTHYHPTVLTKCAAPLLMTLHSLHDQ